MGPGARARQWARVPPVGPLGVAAGDDRMGHAIQGKHPHRARGRAREQAWLAGTGRSPDARLLATLLLGRRRRGRGLTRAAERRRLAQPPGPATTPAGARRPAGGRPLRGPSSWPGSTPVHASTSREPEGVGAAEEPPRGGGGPVTRRPGPRHPRTTSRAPSRLGCAGANPREPATPPRHRRPGPQRAPALRVGPDPETLT